MTNPLLELKALGQSVWLDDIDRKQLLAGQFHRLIDEDGLSGATGNPTIFEHSILVKQHAEAISSVSQKPSSLLP